jgi:hypothetical protein
LIPLLRCLVAKMHDANVPIRPILSHELTIAIVTGTLRRVACGSAFLRARGRGWA